MAVPSYNAYSRARCSLTKTNSFLLFHLDAEGFIYWGTGCSRNDNIFLQKNISQWNNVETIHFKELLTGSSLCRIDWACQWKVCIYLLSYHMLNHWFKLWPSISTTYTNHYNYQARLCWIWLRKSHCFIISETLSFPITILPQIIKIINKNKIYSSKTIQNCVLQQAQKKNNCNAFNYFAYLQFYFQYYWTSNKNVEYLSNSLSYPQSNCGKLKRVYMLLWLDANFISLFISVHMF